MLDAVFVKSISDESGERQSHKYSDHQFTTFLTTPAGLTAGDICFAVR